jgi:hypothetical protein
MILCKGFLTYALKVGGCVPSSVHLQYSSTSFVHWNVKQTFWALTRSMHFWFSILQFYIPKSSMLSANFAKVVCDRVRASDDLGRDPRSPLWKYSTCVEASCPINERHPWPSASLPLGRLKAGFGSTPPSSSSHSRSQPWTGPGARPDCVAVTWVVILLDFIRVYILTCWTWNRAVWRNCCCAMQEVHR